MQEQLGAVTCVGSLDLSDNGEWGCFSSWVLGGDGVLGMGRSLQETPGSLRSPGQTSPICWPGFDSDLLTLVPALGKNKSLKHLFLGKNFNVKAK